jgi:hypothetical protein
LAAIVYLTASDRAPGVAIGELLCPRCGIRLPFTGAFEYVLCPNCRAAVYIAVAPRAPPAPPSAVPLPQSLPPAEALSLFQLPAEPPPHFVRNVARHATTLGTVICMFLLAANLAVMLAGLPVALAYALSGPEPFVPIYIVFPFPILIFELGGGAAAMWHVGLAAAILVSAVHFLRAQVPGALAALNRVFDGRGSPTLSEPNGLFTLTRLFSVCLMCSIAVAAIAWLFNQSPTVPDVLERPWHRYLLGGGFALEGPAVAMLVFQAVVFGAAHVPGWDLWKFPSTFITGLALGYLFLRFGLSACIVFHFLNDYLTATILFTEQTSFPMLVIIGFYIVMVVGVVNGIRYLFVIDEWRRLGRIPDYVSGVTPAAPVSLSRPPGFFAVPPPPPPGNAPAPPPPEAPPGPPPPGLG